MTGAILRSRAPLPSSSGSHHSGVMPSSVTSFARFRLRRQHFTQSLNIASERERPDVATEAAQELDHLDVVPVGGPTDRRRVLGSLPRIYLRATIDQQCATRSALCAAA